MKRTITPKTKVFVLHPASFYTLMACFRNFHDKPHSFIFNDFVMKAPYYQDCVKLSDFKPSASVKAVKIIFEYEQGR